jgi:HEAT repeat protein
LEEELGFVKNIQGMHPDLVEDHLVYFLESPDFFVRANALLSMYNLNLKEKSKIAIYKALKSQLHVSSLVALIILAKNNFTKALPLFRERLSLPSGNLLWSSMIALVMMKDKESYNKIIKIFKESETSSLAATTGARALAMMKNKNTLDCLLEKLVPCPINSAINFGNLK